MAKKFNINLLRVSIVPLLFIAFFLLIISCNRSSNRGSGFSNSINYNCNDTLSKFNLSLYARLSSIYSCSSLPVVIIVTSPTGERYTDTLNFPITERGVEARKVQSGIWQDYEWSYRREIVFNKRGKWMFTVKQNPLSTNIEGVGQVGIKVYQSK